MNKYGSFYASRHVLFSVVQTWRGGAGLWRPDAVTREGVLGLYERTLATGEHRTFT